MRSYSDVTLRELLEAFAAEAPSPGGGSAAAMAAATAASLLMMAARIQKPSEGQSADATAIVERLLAARQLLAALIDRDPEAYSRVIEARRLPAHDDEARRHRRAAIESAMRPAIEAPLEMMRACRAVLAEAPTVSERTPRSVHPDVAVAIDLLQAAVAGAAFVIEANLRAMSDDSYVTRMLSERQQLETESAREAERARSRLLDVS